jgi:DNA modification methylase
MTTHGMIVQADARRIPLADRSVHCCVTSPPFYALRDYGVSGQLGLEPTPSDYVAATVGVFREVKRVLRDDGTCWLNIGDSYASDAKWGGTTGGKHASGLHGEPIGRLKRYTGLKPKDLIGIPWRLAFALQADGWTLRSEIIWAKPNPMPESVTDRPTKSHEQVFLLTKHERYFYDQEAVREESTTEPHARGGIHAALGGPMDRNGHSQYDAAHQSRIWGGSGRNLRSVWSIASAPFSGAHFATFPLELAARCIRAGTSERGVCPACGAPWRRVVERG